MSRHEMPSVVLRARDEARDAAQDAEIARRRAETEREEITRNIRGTLGPVLLEAIDDGTGRVTDVYCNPDGEWWVRERGRARQVGVRWHETSVRHLIQLVAGLNGKVVNRGSPELAGSLPGGQRFHGMLHHVVADGPAVAIRVMARETFSIEDFERDGRLSPQVREHVETALARELNVVFAGKTGTAKTSFMSACLMHPAVTGSRVGTIEEVLELRLDAVPDKVRMTVSAGVDEEEVAEEIDRRTRSALRMMFDRLIVGEARGGELRKWVNAMYTGHRGGWVSVHASNPRRAMTRMEGMLHEVVRDIAAWRTRLCEVTERIVQMELDPRGGGRVAGIYGPVHYDERRNRFEVEHIAGVPLDG